MHPHCSYLPVGDLEQSQCTPSVGTPRVAPLGLLTPQAASDKRGTELSGAGLLILLGS